MQLPVVDLVVQSHKSEVELERKLQETQTAALDEKNELNKMYQNKIQNMISEHTAAIDHEQQLSSAANGKHREIKSLLEAAESRLSMHH